MPAAAAPAPAATPGAHNPGHGLGIAGLILAFFIPLVGLILSLIAKSKSKAAGMSNGVAKAGVILSAIFLVLQTLWIALIVAGSFKAVQDCAQNGTRTTGADGTVSVQCN
jgi:hypothetical protein